MLAAALLLAAGVPATAQEVGPVPAAITDRDERGLWQRANEAEAEARTSRMVITDQALNRYVRDVLCRTVGADKCGQARIYIVRSPHFNASMAPNGLMTVNTGLLMRLGNEAELAAVLGHEFAHFEGRHSLRAFKDARAKTDLASAFAIIPYVGIVGQMAALGSVFSFSREMEREADEKSLTMLRATGYAPNVAPGIWRTLMAEMDATAAARGRTSQARKPAGFFATHPATPERVDYLTRLSSGDRGGDLGADRYAAAIMPWWPQMIDDQIKRNDFGGTAHIIAQRAVSGWTGPLYYAQAEMNRARARQDDLGKAIEAYRAAITSRYDTPEVRRGLGLALLRNGQAEAGKSALREYLKARPDAADRATIAMYLGE